MVSGIAEWKEVAEITNVYKPPLTTVRVFQFAGTEGGFWTVAWTVAAGAWWCGSCQFTSCRHIDAAKRHVDGKCALCTEDAPHKHDPASISMPAPGQRGGGLTATNAMLAVPCGECPNCGENLWPGTRPLLAKAKSVLIIKCGSCDFYWPANQEQYKEALL